jgi:glycosyltransferase involved in cell wall biosynthesis
MWNRNGRSYRRGRALVRLHGKPLGIVDFNAEDPCAEADAIAERAWNEFHGAINAHLAGDELATPAERGAAVLRTTVPPRCERERDAFRATAPLATVIIATRERQKSLAATLDSVFAIDYPNYDVVVVDNAPTTSATRALVDTRYADRTNLLYVCEPVRGLAAAHNTGLTHARGEFAAFIDDDVVVDPRWLFEIARAFEWAANVACVTGLILPAELETAAQVWVDDHVNLNKGYEPRLFDTRTSHPDAGLLPYATGTVGSGANMAFRTDALRALGGFDPATGAGTRARGGDDLAAFFGILAGGDRVAYQPAAIVRHLYRRDVEGLRRQMFDYGAGLGAYLTKVVLDHPTLLLDVARRAPAGAARVRRARSNGRENDSPELTAQLTRLEWLGMIAGPAGYLLERRHRRTWYDGPRRGTVAVGPP